MADRKPRAKTLKSNKPKDKMDKWNSPDIVLKPVDLNKVEFVSKPHKKV